MRRSGSGCTLDETEEILNDIQIILFVHTNIDKRLIKKQIFNYKLIFSGGMLLKKF